MPFELQYQEGDPYMRIIPLGDVGLEDLMEIMQTISSDDRFTCTKRLWDLRQCLLNASSEDMQKIADMGRGLDGGESRAAILADTDLNFGLARLHMVYRENADAQFMVFRSEGEALEWLLR